MLALVSIVGVVSLPAMHVGVRIPLCTHREREHQAVYLSTACLITGALLRWHVMIS